VSLSHDREEIDRVQNAVLDAAARHGYSKESMFALRLAMEEAISNAFRHGHKDLPKDLPIRVQFDVNDARIWLAVEDQGPGFNPVAVKDPTLDENLEEPSGRGLMLMRAFMAAIKHNAKGNRIELTYKKPAAKG
jgi:serine/threonine-protein kinase RsbW